MQAFRCSCGEEITIHLSTTETYGCGVCGAVHRKGGDSFERTTDTIVREPSPISLRDSGKLLGRLSLVIGILHRQDSESSFSWREYLLMDGDGETRWLIEAEGHWGIVAESEKPMVLSQGVVRFQKRRYSIFHKGQALTVSFSGEIPWRAEVGERVAVRDFISPPFMLNWEKSGSESWFAGQYIESDAVRKAFNVKKMPRKRGVAPAQPAPFSEIKGSILKVFGAGAAILFLMHMAFMMTGAGQRVIDGSLAWPGDKDQVTYTTEPFDLAGTGNVEVNFGTNLANSWLYAEARLVNETSNEAWSAGESLEFYSGVEDGESWKEGSQAGARILPNVGPGKYRIVFVLHGPPGSGRTYVNYQVNRNAVSHGNLIAGWLVLALLPFFMYIRTSMFEAARWNQSDFQPGGVSK